MSSGYHLEPLRCGHNSTSLMMQEVDAFLDKNGSEPGILRRCGLAREQVKRMTASPATDAIPLPSENDVEIRARKIIEARGTVRAKDLAEELGGISYHATAIIIRHLRAAGWPVIKTYGGPGNTLTFYQWVHDNE